MLQQQLLESEALVEELNHKLKQETEKLRLEGERSDSLREELAEAKKKIGELESYQNFLTKKIDGLEADLVSFEVCC